MVTDPANNHNLSTRYTQANPLALEAKAHYLVGIIETDPTYRVFSVSKQQEAQVDTSTTLPLCRLAIKVKPRDIDQQHRLMRRIKIKPVTTVVSSSRASGHRRSPTQGKAVIKPSLSPGIRGSKNDNSSPAVKARRGIGIMANLGISTPRQYQHRPIL